MLLICSVWDFSLNFLREAWFLIYPMMIECRLSHPGYPDLLKSIGRANHLSALSFEEFLRLSCIC